MSDGFYRAFEDRYRGSRELVKGRLEIYLPFVEPLHLVYPDASAVDLGCGRGEWLEVLRAKGISAVGVDLDQGMLNDCHTLGLNVEMGDAIGFLSMLPDESQIVVSGFHLAEHLPFDLLQQLVGEALRVLRPGGILILETPNPENLTVGTSSFYLDPTHARPIPPLLLGFLPEYAGFMRVKTVRLQEPAHLLATEKTSLLDVIGGVSPDYAVIAQKEAEDGIIALTENAFGRQYGLDLETLAKRFDSQIAGSFQQAESKAQQAESKAQQAEDAAGHWQTQANEWHDRLLATHASTSWKITRPLRAIKRLLAGDFAAFGGSTAAVKIKVKKTFRPVVSSGISYILDRPALRKALSPCLKCFPGLRQRMLRVAVHTGVLPAEGHSLPGVFQNTTWLDRPIAEHAHRTPGAAPDIDAILERIKVALEKGPDK